MSRGLGDVYKRQGVPYLMSKAIAHSIKAFLTSETGEDENVLHN